MKQRRTTPEKSSATNDIEKSDAPAKERSEEYASLTKGELGVLAEFRKYLMTPGQMLCLSNTDIGSKQESLDKLTDCGLLVREEFKGGYSLTRKGFQVMKELD